MIDIPICVPSFKRRNADGDIDHSLIPTSVQDWYEKTDSISDDEEAVSDIEWE